MKGCSPFGMLLGLLLIATAQAQPPLLRGDSAGEAFRVDKLAQLDGIPWGMTFVAADQLLITLRKGQLWLLDTTSGQTQPIDGVPKVWSEGQGGLMDIRTGPDFANSRFLYLTYSKARAKDNHATTALHRCQWRNNRLENCADLFVANAYSDTGRHFGSRIAFDNKGHVYFGIGDRGVRDNGQDLNNDASTIIRLNLDGSIPDDNPGLGTIPAAWAYGVRNPQGLVYQTSRNTLWENEHGPRGGDEINRIIKGGNYGWPVVSYGKEYWNPWLNVGQATSKPGMEQPIYQYTPSIAPSSLLIYSGKRFAAWQGHFFAGALALRHLNQVALNKDQTQVVAEYRLLKSLDQRIRNVIEAPNGDLVVASDGGGIMRLSPDETNAN